MIWRPCKQLGREGAPLLCGSSCHKSNMKPGQRVNNLFGKNQNHVSSIKVQKGQTKHSLKMNVCFGSFKKLSHLKKQKHETHRNASLKKQNLYMFPWICPLPCMKKIHGIDNGSHRENKLDHQPTKIFGKTILCFAYMSPVTSIVNRKLPEKT